MREDSVDTRRAAADGEPLDDNLLVTQDDAQALMVEEPSAGLGGGARRAARARPRPSIKNLVNHGISILNDPGTPPPPQRTFVVLGVARGGTTMVASVLHALGVPMGERLSAVYEDVEVARPMESLDLPAVREIVARRNAAHERWGFKRPNAVGYAVHYEDELRNPEYIVVFRDPFAIANRNRLSVDQDLVAGLRDAARRTSDLIEFLLTQQRRTLLISYEKALLSPETLVGAVAEFAGVDDMRAMRQALRAIRPGNKDYLEQSRTGRSVGRIERLDGRKLRGWATIQGATAPAQVEVRVNKRPVATVTASRPRPDLKRRGVHATGACGFVVELPASVVLAPGDTITARVVTDFKQLRNSPMIVPHATEQDRP